MRNCTENKPTDPAFAAPRIVNASLLYCTLKCRFPLIKPSEPMPSPPPSHACTSSEVVADSARTCGGSGAEASNTAARKNGMNDFMELKMILLTLHPR